MFPQRFTLSLLFCFLICSLQITCAPFPAQESINNPSISPLADSATIKLSSLPHYLANIFKNCLNFLNKQLSDEEYKKALEFAEGYTKDLLRGAQPLRNNNGVLSVSSRSTNRSPKSDDGLVVEVSASEDSLADQDNSASIESEDAFGDGEDIPDFI